MDISGQALNVFAPLSRIPTPVADGQVRTDAARPPVSELSRPAREQARAYAELSRAVDRLQAAWTHLQEAAATTTITAANDDSPLRFSSDSLGLTLAQAVGAPLADTLPTVTSGSFMLGAAEVIVDAEQDSLISVLSKINAQHTDVDASFDGETGTITLKARGDAQSVTIDDGTTNFFTAIGVDAGTHASAISEDDANHVTRTVLDNREQVKTALADVASALNHVFAGYTGKQAHAAKASVEAVLREMSADAFGVDTQTRDAGFVREQFGFKVAFGVKDTAVVQARGSSMSDLVAERAAQVRDLAQPADVTQATAPRLADLSSVGRAAAPAVLGEILGATTLGATTLGAISLEARSTSRASATAVASFDPKAFIVALEREEHDVIGFLQGGDGHAGLIPTLQRGLTDVHTALENEASLLSLRGALVSTTA